MLIYQLMKPPRQELNAHQPSLFQSVVNRVMKRTVISDPATEIDQLTVDPTDISGLDFDAQTPVVDASVYSGLLPSREVFSDMVDKGDTMGMVRALGAATRSLRARSEAATDEAVRELREMGVDEKEIQAALQKDRPQGQPRMERHIEKMNVLPPKSPKKARMQYIKPGMGYNSSTSKLPHSYRPL